MSVRLCVSSVDDHLYLMRQLLSAVVTHNVYSETQDAANSNKALTWLCSVADWLLALKSRLCWVVPLVSKLCALLMFLNDCICWPPA